jgi:hypothetical protein
MTAEELRPVAEYLRQRAIAQANNASHSHVPALRSYYLDRAAELDALADLVGRAMGEGVTP